MRNLKLLLAAAPLVCAVACTDTTGSAGGTGAAAPTGPTSQGPVERKPLPADASQLVAQCTPCHGANLLGSNVGGTEAPNLSVVLSNYSPESFDQLLAAGIRASGDTLALMRGSAVTSLTPDQRALIYQYLGTHLGAAM